MLVYLFTGTRALLPRHWPLLLESIGALCPHGPHNHLCFISGMQYGVDTAAAGIAYDLYPQARHHLVRPAAPCNTALPKLLPNAKEHVAPKGANAGASYRLRDQYMVDLAVQLGDPLASGAQGRWQAQCLAYPLRAEGSQRYSGTWLTVRLWAKAVAANRPHAGAAWALPSAVYQLEN